MIEKAPNHIEENDTIELMVSLNFEGLLKTFQDDYLYWDKIKYKSKSYDPEKVWKAVKLHRRLRSTSVSFGNYTFSFVVTDFMQRALHHFDLNIGGNLSSNIGIAETDKNKFIISSIMEEAISSSQMEGANTTRKKAKEMIQREQKPTNKSEQMILNNFITMKHIVQHKNQSVTSDRILALHQLMVKDTLEKKEEEGKFRNSNDVFVVDHSSSEVVHQPPSYEELELLMKDLCDFCNEESEYFIHPIIKGCIIHFMIGWIHPFVDGNGRTARALFYWYMLKQGYLLTEYLSISRIIKDTKAQYEKSFLYSEIDGNDLSYFITYHIKTLEKSFDALKVYINKKQKEVFQAAQFMSLPGVNERMAQIIKLIHDDPERILNIKEIESRFSISNFTARADLNSLVKFGFLEIIQVNKKKRNYIRAKNFESRIRKFTA